MALEGVRQFGDIRSLLTGKGGMRFKSFKATGAAADTNITCTGIKLGDVIVSAWEVETLDITSGSPFLTDVSQDIRITAADTIQCDTEDTTGNHVIITWLSV